MFHCCKESENNIKKALTLIKDKKLACMALILNKEKVYTRLQNEKHILYNWVVNLLIDVLITKNILPQEEKIFFIASRRETNKTLNENFLSYLKSQNKDKLDIEFVIKTAYQEKGLQVVDVLSYAIYQKYEHGNDELYSMIENFIIEEKNLFS